MIKEVYFDGIGKIVIVKSLQARHLRITVRPDTSVRVTLPAGTDYDQGFAFIEKKLSWIKKSIKNMKKKCAIPAFRFPGRNFLTSRHDLILEKTVATTLTGKISGENVIIGIPEGFSPEHPEVASFIRFMTEKVLRLEAGKYLPERITMLASKHGFQFGRITLRNMRSRWGSCSSANNISMNIHLMRLPEYLRDYVILHELVHTRIKNHGPDFWKHLNRLTNNRARLLQKEMRNYSAINY